MGLMGIPVFAGISSGPLVFLGPTGGYLIGFVLGAFACGYAFERLNEKAPLTPFIAGAAGIATIYMFGTPWLAMWLKLTGKPFSDCLSGAWQLGVVPFIGIDILKTAAASSMALGGRSWHGMIEPFKNIGW